MITFQLPAEVEALRDQIAELQGDIAAQESIALSDAEVVERIDFLVDTHAKRGQKARILAHLVHPKATPIVTWPIDHKGNRIEPSAFDLLCAMNPEQMRADLRRLVKESDHPRGPTKAGREKRLETLRKDLRSLEIEEEKLICALQSRGVHVHRRPDCDPSIVLEN